MKYTPPTTPLTEDDVRALGEEYKLFIERLRLRWLRHNNDRRRGMGRLYETDPIERERVDGVIRRWGQYVTPVAEAWWKRRGFGVIWPEEPSSETCRVYLLESEAA